MRCGSTHAVLSPARRRAARAPMVAHGAAPASGRTRPITYDVMDSWQSIQGTRLSDDGQWLAYALTAQGEDGELVVRNLAQRPGAQEPARHGPVVHAGRQVRRLHDRAAQGGRRARGRGRIRAGRTRTPAPEGAGQGRAAAARRRATPRTGLGIMTLPSGEVKTIREGRQLPPAGRVVDLARLLQGRRRNQRRRARRRRRTWGRGGGGRQAGPARRRRRRPPSAVRKTGARQHAARKAQGPRLGSHPPQPRDQAKRVTIPDVTEYEFDKNGRLARVRDLVPGGDEGRRLRAPDRATAPSRRCSPAAATTRASRSTRRARSSRS